jgi:thiol-disulfide isomerase/thioredoxin
MIRRVSFIVGAASFVTALPVVACPDEPAPEVAPSPSAVPSPSAAPSKRKAAPAPRSTEAPHVHGNNGVTSIPEHRRVEWGLEVLDGPRFRLSEYRGKAVFINLFATWCGPCRTEQPGLVAFARAYPDDTAVIGIDLWEEDNEVRDYRKKFAIPYPIAMHRERGTLPAIFRQQKLAYPTTLVFRPDGVLSCAWQGDVNVAWFEMERRYALAEQA